MLQLHIGFRVRVKVSVSVLIRQTLDEWMGPKVHFSPFFLLIRSAKLVFLLVRRVIFFGVKNFHAPLYQMVRPLVSLSHCSEKKYNIAEEVAEMASQALMA